MKHTDVVIGETYRVTFKHGGWFNGLAKVIGRSPLAEQKECFQVQDEAGVVDVFNAMWLEPALAVPPNKSALNTQQGGGHYKDLKIQPVEYIHGNNIPYLEGNVIKYVTRWRNKNGVEDLLKAKHYIDLIIELENKETK